MAGSHGYFGFEILNKLVEEQVHKKEDVIILFAHWFLVKNGFRCIGLGDSKTFNRNQKGSELLPEEWSQSNHYSLRYLKEGKLYILLGRKSDSDLLLNILTIADNCSSTVKFDVNTTILELHGPLLSLIPRPQEVQHKLQKELVDPVYAGSAREISTQTAAASRPHVETSGGSPPDNILRVGPASRALWPPDRDVTGVGRNDIDPFGGIGPARGGGMIFDPFRPANPGLPNPLGPLPGGIGGPGRLPPGAIPPGARFDPFGPPDLVQPRPRPRNPDHDHELPPGGYDDMFM
ncbi:proteasome inhibitor PI31 subunit [Diachasma alloeum]|uniref:proteasome inhibitor PI31 subunit n=1 Tax=Diachasma alloeum TaxID=454923 RepID=UPI0007383CD3|nr:proteasome inhibitor PI31 subunit [Diachasma alloeum]